MSQYHPMHRALKFPPLGRAISPSEYEAVLRVMNKVGLENGWLQEMGADKIYLPDFDSKSHPFALKNQP
jgi:putative pyruvate formate lyase activating enzyme